MKQNEITTVKEPIVFTLKSNKMQARQINTIFHIKIFRSML